MFTGLDPSRSGRAGKGCKTHKTGGLPIMKKPVVLVVMDGVGDHVISACYVT